VNIFGLGVGSLRSIFGVFRIVLFIVDWLCNWTRFSIGFIDSSSLNFSLFDGNGGNGGVSWWIGTMNSFLRIGISSCWSSVIE
jgi:hypothetical protein